VEQFRRINRSQLVNMSRVRELRPWFHGDFRAILEDGTELNWSRRYSPKSHLTRAQAR
jgi:two-component system LytT family response regulator